MEKVLERDLNDKLNEERTDNFNRQQLLNKALNEASKAMILKSFDEKVELKRKAMNVEQLRLEDIIETLIDDENAPPLNINKQNELVTSISESANSIEKILCSRYLSDSSRQGQHQKAVKFTINENRFEETEDNVLKVLEESMEKKLSKVLDFPPAVLNDAFHLAIESRLQAFDEEIDSIDMIKEMEELSNHFVLTSKQKQELAENQLKELQNFHQKVFMEAENFKQQISNGLDQCDELEVGLILSSKQKEERRNYERVVTSKNLREHMNYLKEQTKKCQTLRNQAFSTDRAISQLGVLNKLNVAKAQTLLLKNKSLAKTCDNMTEGFKSKQDHLLDNYESSVLQKMIEWEEHAQQQRERLQSMSFEEIISAPSSSTTATTTEWLEKWIKDGKCNDDIIEQFINIRERAHYSSTPSLSSTTTPSPISPLSPNHFIEVYKKYNRQQQYNDEIQKQMAESKENIEQLDLNSNEKELESKCEISAYPQHILYVLKTKIIQLRH
eukprot:TRINITY_DN438_c0_g1_i3.p1 TRINITY_DN438_c0_g1~~TRINITY_DN438_c0_g1_i3.p1  ORF type:complete len:500 (-),score=108.26 TRINITY_DN438_c0_g1_i3:108-1607(-)